MFCGDERDWDVPAISMIAVRTAVARRSGGSPSGLACDLAADNAEAAYERHPVRVEIDVVGCPSHEIADSIMTY
jgi:hypothetical protein